MGNSTRTPAYCVATLTIDTDENLIAVTGQPTSSVLTVYSVDEETGTGEGLLVCHGATTGAVLPDRAAAAVKFEELAGRPPAAGELP